MSHMFSALLWIYFLVSFLTAILMSFKGEEAKAYAESTILNFITLNSYLTLVSFSFKKRRLF